MCLPYFHYCPHSYTDIPKRWSTNHFNPKDVILDAKTIIMRLMLLYLPL